jgi:hypothetical protein
MIYLSAGHFPAAPGAAWKGFVEHPEAVRWVREIRVCLDYATIVPPMELGAKIRWINERCARDDYLVEVHFNKAGDNPSPHGAETLYAPGSVNGLKFATDLQRVLARYFRNRGVKEGWLHGDPKKGALGLLAKTRCTAVIIEPEFVYHAARINEHRGLCCAALATAMRKHQ